MRIVRALDAGPVADLEVVPIGPTDTALEVEARLAAAAPVLLARAIPALMAGRLEFVEQDNARASYCRKLSRADGVLDFAAPARVLAARINGLNPWPSASVALGGETIRVGRAQARGPAPADRPDERCPVSQGGDGASGAVPGAVPATVPGVAPGTVLGADASGLLVATGDGTLRLLALQRAGGRMLPAADFLRGFPVPAGTVIASSPMPPLVASAPFRPPARTAAPPAPAPGA